MCTFLYEAKHSASKKKKKFYYKYPLAPIENDISARKSNNVDFVGIVLRCLNNLAISPLQENRFFQFNKYTIVISAFLF